MNERSILEQRVVTLNGLLDIPEGPLGSKAGTLGRQFRERWRAERRLIQRILEEAPQDAADADMTATLALWRDRTTAFIRGTNDEQPSWTDRHGTVWDAHLVLALLDDVQERIEAWKAPDVVGDALDADDEPANVGPTG
ncbi:hypothetical protein DCC79_05170 [bacterium]|nr:hypothetical protein [Chloroflexi bacterium CFX6]RIL11332.1 MAG: hypothetical protein DCC79_05170 [bacterium]